VTHALLADVQPISEIHANGAADDPALHLQAIMARRRSIRRLHDGPFSGDARARLLEAIRLTPAAYNLPPWRVILVHERRDDLWVEIERGFHETLSGDRLERYLDRLHGFREGVAVTLIFADRRVERALREEKGASPEVAQGFVQQALGMVQLALWLAITAEGMVTSLQHWDEWIGARAARFAGLPDDDFALIATMPIGYAAEEPKAIERAAPE
jgi:predicted oxidoreductase (fatty acid repression mutant protein)